MKRGHRLLVFHGVLQGLQIDRNAILDVECKRAGAPRLTPSIRIALEDLGLERLA